MSVLCRVCHVSIFGLFPVLVWCDYWLILVQPCLSNYLWFTCVFIVLSVQFDFVWSTHYSRCFLSALSCHVCIKDYYLSLRPRLRVLVPPCCVHCDNQIINFLFIYNNSIISHLQLVSVHKNAGKSLHVALQEWLLINCLEKKKVTFWRRKKKNHPLTFKAAT